jgi:hypothetical protein
VRRVRQAQHEAAKEVITWAVDNRIGALAAGDPRGALSDKAEAAGITVRLVDELGTWPAPARPQPRQTAAHGESLAATRGARNKARDNPRPTYGQAH